MSPSFDASLLAGSSCAFGVFDGVHVGHRYLLDAAMASARDSGGLAVALTFDKDPDELFAAGRLRKLLGNDDRIAMLSECGVDCVCVLPFTTDFAKAGPQEFLETTFSGGAPAALHVGSDFRFGAKASGDVADLRAWALSSGTEIHAHTLVAADGMPVTATRIRTLLLEGKIDEANRLLGYPYTLADIVARGRGAGAGFGFATANMEIAANKRVLAEGVYAGYGIVGGKKHRAAIAVGVSPFFEQESSANIEVHLLDFSGDLYGERIVVQFVSRIRPMVRFENEQELIDTVRDNIEWVRGNLPL